MPYSLWNIMEMHYQIKFCSQVTYLHSTNIHYQNTGYQPHFYKKISIVWDNMSAVNSSVKNSIILYYSLNWIPDPLPENVILSSDEKLKRKKETQREIERGAVGARDLLLCCDDLLNCAKCLPTASYLRSRGVSICVRGVSH